LVLHRSAGEIACHHCGHREPAPTRCTSCGSPGVARRGAGTERLHRELDATLGESDFPVFRLDSDTAAARGEVAAVLAAVARATAGILRGTQVVGQRPDVPHTP